MSVVDASVLVSRYWPGDAFHGPSRQWLGRSLVAGAPLVAPTILLAEVAGAITRRTNDPRLGQSIAQQIHALPNLQLVAIDDTLGQAAARLVADHRLRGADAVYAAVAEHLQLPLISWDNEQLTRLAPHITTLTPDQT